MTDHDEPHMLSGAYVLNALGDQERAEYEQFLAQSEEARTEVAGMSDTAVLLGLASQPVTPSPQLKANLMALIATTAQLPPVEEDSVDETLADTRAGDGRAQTALPAPEQPFVVQESAFALPEAPLTAEQPLDSAEPATPTTDEQRTISSIADGRRTRSSHRAQTKANARWFQRSTGALLATAAALALVVGGIGGTLIGLSLNSDEQALSQLSAADDLRQAVEPVAGGGTATLIWSDDQQRSAILLDGLDQLSADEIYQLWYIDDAGATSAGTFSTTATGTTLRLLQGSRTAGDIIGVTVEPAGGSEAPTTDPIVLIDA